MASNETLSIAVFVLRLFKNFKNLSSEPKWKEIYQNVNSGYYSGVMGYMNIALSSLCFESESFTYM